MPEITIISDDVSSIDDVTEVVEQTSTEEKPGETWQSAVAKVEQKVDSLMDSILSEVRAQTARMEDSQRIVTELLATNARLTEQLSTQATLLTLPVLEETTAQPEVEEAVNVVEESPEVVTSPAEVESPRPRRRTL